MSAVVESLATGAVIMALLVVPALLSKARGAGRVRKRWEERRRRERTIDQWPAHAEEKP